MKSAQRLSIEKGASFVEYSLLIAIVAAALLGMQFYIKRAICSNWKKAGDVFGSGMQYQPVGPKKTTIN